MLKLGSGQLPGGDASAGLRSQSSVNFDCAFGGSASDWFSNEMPCSVVVTLDCAIGSSVIVGVRCNAVSPALSRWICATSLDFAGIFTAMPGKNVWTCDWTWTDCANNTPP